MFYYFIGIGGIGMSALAQYFKEKGNRVEGSDAVESEIIKFLRTRGIPVSIGEKDAVPEGIDYCVISQAISTSHKERQDAQKKNLPIKTYQEALGEVTKEYTTIAVSGMHGKSTTTAMVSRVFIEAGFDPTIIIGTKVPFLGNNNFRFGKSNYLIIEADEYRAAVLYYWPKVVVVLNLEPEHLDYYRDINHINSVFEEFLSHVPKNGFVAANAENDNATMVAKKAKNNPKLVFYSTKQEEANKIKSLMQVPGIHNVSNALAVLAIARFFGIKDEVTYKALSGFTGTWRRFETVQEVPFTVISDYAHHPSEVRATLDAVAEKYAGKKIKVFFQPHQAQRTHYLFNNFVEVFKNAKVSEVYITDIYDVKGREVKSITSETSAQRLVDAIAKDSIKYIPFELVGKKIANTEDGAIVIIMGAGAIDNYAQDYRDKNK